MFFNKQEQTTLFCTTAANGDLSFPKKYEYLDPVCAQYLHVFIKLWGQNIILWGPCALREQKLGSKVFKFSTLAKLAKKII